MRHDGRVGNITRTCMLYDCSGDSVDKRIITSACILICNRQLTRIFHLSLVIHEDRTVFTITVAKLLSKPYQLSEQVQKDPNHHFTAYSLENKNAAHHGKNTTACFPNTHQNY